MTPDISPKSGCSKYESNNVCSGLVIDLKTEPLLVSISKVFTLKPVGLLYKYI